ncbi:MFS transporter [Pelagicoccus albus]|uniref:MFS transporter n=1 Tax=Pelagicoccus albus TaxID=415222 RepID=A0A7X1B5X2_9BACT|nr:MFS transporter [Pelagicoccus albus]MBC2606220.1 MFS transporter [Pelagicoccus albus]
MQKSAPLSYSYRLIGSQGLNALGDHIAKITASALVAALFPERQAAVWVGVISALYVLPYIFLAPVAGKLTGRFSKSAVVRGSLLLQAAATAGLGFSAIQGSFGGVIASLALVACQSSLLAPSRNALLKDLCGTERLGQMMGLLGLAGVGATLVGLAVGGWSFDQLWKLLGDPWQATAIAGAASSLFALFAYGAVSRIDSNSETEVEKDSSFIAAARELFARPVLRWTSLGLAWFYGVGAMLIMILLQDSRLDHGQSVGSASQGGGMAALLGFGVAAGSGLAAYLCRRRIEVGLSFLGVVLLSVFIPLTALFWDNDGMVSAGVLILGLAGGLFSAPLNALFVASARDDARVTSIAANNLLINVVSGAFVLIASAMGYMGWSPQAQLWIVAGTSVVVTAAMTVLVPESLVRLVLMAACKVFYSLKPRYTEKLPREGGTLLVSNHVSYADALLIWASSPRPVQFVGTDELLKYPLMKWVYRKFNVIPVSPRRAKDAVSKTVDALKAGGVVCLFPEGALTRTGMVMPFKKGAELIARLAQVPVVPLAIDGMWGSVFSFSDKPFRYRWGQPLRRQVSLAFGDAVKFDQASVESLREAVLDLSQDGFSNRRKLEKSLAYLSLKVLARKPFSTKMVDRSLGSKRFRNYQLSVAALGVSRYLIKDCPAARVGVLLPPFFCRELCWLNCIRWLNSEGAGKRPCYTQAGVLRSRKGFL